MNSQASVQLQPQVDLGLEESGIDSEGFVYKNPKHMWAREIEAKLSDPVEAQTSNSKIIGDINNWYHGALKYWEKTNADIEGVLGGFGFTHDIDIADSAKLITRLKDDHQVELDSVLECGAGIGRISHALLTKVYERTDIVEPAANLMGKAKETLEGNPKMGNFYQQGMQEFTFEKSYDTIWIQWVIGHLTDNDLISFLVKCKQNLKPNGVVVVKDNACGKHAFWLDKADFSVARSVKYYEALFNHAGFELLMTEHFSEFPPTMLPIYKFVIRPKRE